MRFACARGSNELSVVGESRVGDIHSVDSVWTTKNLRATGGLADTISHFDAATGLGNGSVFRDADPQGVLWGVRTALEWFDDPAAWAHLMRNAMAADFSWPNRVPQYEELYRSLV